MNERWLRNGADEDTRKRWLQERQWVPQCREVRKAPDLEFTLETAGPEKTSGFSACLEKRFLSMHRNSVPMPGSFEYRKDLFPQTVHSYF